jgi:uncharacterized protein (TIGR03083 family)
VDYRAALLEENHALGEVFRDADRSATVPTCPGWTLIQLLRHIGRGDRWAAQIVSDRLDEYLDPRSVEGGKPPADADGEIDWLNSGAQQLIDAVEQIGPDASVWTFRGPRPAKWWIRRRLHEVTVHRADAAIAAGTDYDIAPDLAADAISEWLDIMVPWDRTEAGPTPVEAGNSLHLHATDDGLDELGEWMIVGAADGISWSHDHGKGGVALRGPAKDLLLAITRRRPAADTGVEIHGDPAIWQTWLDRTAF